MRALTILSALTVWTPLALGSQSRATPSEALAFISPTEARFVFPADPRQIYHWSLPGKGGYPGKLDYWWLLSWPAQYIRDGEDPRELWLMARWKPGGPYKGTLAKLVKGATLDPMINCITCDNAVFRDPERDTTKVFATVERGRLVFNIRGREAVSRIFPNIPDTVTFVSMGNQGGGGDSGLGENHISQTVLVNCRLPQTARRNCIIERIVPKKQPNADSAAAENSNRTLSVAVLNFRDVRVVPHTDVVIKTAEKTWRVMSTGTVGAFTILRPPLGPLFLVARCPPPYAHRNFGTQRVYMTPGLDTVVHMMTDPKLCSSTSSP